MNRGTMIAQFRGQIETHLPSLGAWQALGRAVMGVGLVSQGGAHLSRLAEGISEAGGYNTGRQRVKGRVSKGRLDLTTVRAGLLVDETKLGERWAIRMVSLA